MLFPYRGSTKPFNLLIRWLFGVPELGIRPKIFLVIDSSRVLDFTLFYEGSYSLICLIRLSSKLNEGTTDFTPFLVSMPVTLNYFPSELSVSFSSAFRKSFFLGGNELLLINYDLPCFIPDIP